MAIYVFLKIAILSFCIASRPFQILFYSMFSNIDIYILIQAWKLVLKSISPDKLGSIFLFLFLRDI